jgi:uncharacterized DUF497 family protein
VCGNSILAPSALAGRGSPFHSLDLAKVAACRMHTMCISWQYVSPVRPCQGGCEPQEAWVSFADAEGVLSDPLAVTIEDSDAEGESRFVSIGLGSVGEVLVVVYAEREGDFRLVSARRPSPQERKHYET